MLRRDVLRTGAAAGFTGFAGCPGGTGGPDFTDGFEDDIGEWESDATIEPEVDVGDFQWELDVSNTEAAEGDRSLRIWNEGDDAEDHPRPLDRHLPVTGTEFLYSASLQAVGPFSFRRKLNWPTADSLLIPGRKQVRVHSWDFLSDTSRAVARRRYPR